jgi:hypothetical protein
MVTRLCVTTSGDPFAISLFVVAEVLTVVRSVSPVANAVGEFAVDEKCVKVSVVFNSDSEERGTSINVTAEVDSVASPVEKAVDTKPVELVLVVSSKVVIASKLALVSVTEFSLVDFMIVVYGTELCVLSPVIDTVGVFAVVEKCVNVSAVLSSGVEERDTSLVITADVDSVVSPVEKPVDASPVELVLVDSCNVVIASVLGVVRVTECSLADFMLVVSVTELSVESPVVDTVGLFAVVEKCVNVSIVLISDFDDRGTSLNFTAEGDSVASSVEKPVDT